MARIAPIASYKYNYTDNFVPDRFSDSGQFVISLLTLIIFAFVGYLLLHFYGFVPVIIFAIVLGRFAWKLLYVKKMLHFFPRFMTIGKIMIYYENITNIDESKLADGEFRIDYLASGKSRQLVFNRDNFPTDANKPHKVLANTQGKLEKTLKRIKLHRDKAYSWRLQNGFIKRASAS